MQDAQACGDDGTTSPSIKSVKAEVLKTVAGTSTHDI